MNSDTQFENILEGKAISEQEIKVLCSKAKEILVAESNV